MITGRLVEHFTLDEMMCRNGTLVLTPEAVQHAQRLEKLRLWYALPMHVNSWYRSLEYNRTLPDSTDKSQHILGLATDISLPKEFFKFSKQRQEEFINNMKEKWFQLCECGGGFGIYPTFFHIDSREGTPTTWDER